MKQFSMKGLKNHKAVIGKTRYGMITIQEQGKPFFTFHPADKANIEAKKSNNYFMVANHFQD
ncbi:hypothetical protein [Acidithiobacillus acidisediminis]|jgi:hypothetical protein|uniref:hypothetical protein n=1 Tax=Acidithiobacillus acidisediminis TaxID=2937799 RepID=UPI00200C86FF|nr:hypothetical protein [Acidithiobacillus sp. S30A2]